MRPSRDDTYLEVARAFAKRSTCKRGQVGAVIVKDRRIISTGYNGAPTGAQECIESECLTRELYHWSELRDDYVQVPTGCQRAVHAEANAIAWAARHGLPVGEATMYCTHGPCLHCAQLMVTAGIVKVIFETPYRLTNGLELLTDLDIEWEQYGSPVH